MFTTIKKPVKDSEIRSNLEDLKHDYCDDKIGNAEYLLGLEALLDSSDDVITRSKIKYIMSEVEASIGRGN
jgi:hypothetical protein